MACITCPFAFTDESEQAQNYGCLPTPLDIIRMKRESGHNWACHHNENQKCKGFEDFVKYNQESEFSVDKMKDIDTSTGNLISYETWCHEGPEAAIKEADERGKQNENLK